jgi:hypothetical protein
MGSQSDGKFHPPVQWLGTLGNREIKVSIAKPRRKDRGGGWYMIVQVAIANADLAIVAVSGVQTLDDINPSSILTHPEYTVGVYFIVKSFIQAPR